MHPRSTQRSIATELPVVDVAAAAAVVVVVG